MATLDKTYSIKLDVKNEVSNNIPQYYVSDNQTSELLITITNGNVPVILDNVIVLMVAISPDKEKLYDFLDVRTAGDGLIYCNLKSQFKDLQGTWYARLMIISNEEKLVTDTFSYNVKTDDFIDMNDEVIDDDRYPLLTDIISRLSTIEITEISRQNIEALRVKEEKIRVANENTRIANEQSRQTQHSASIKSIDNKIVDIENRFRTMSASQQQDSEVIDARDGEISLHARLERDLAKGKIIEEKSEGTYITVNDSVDGYLTDIEILGNTTQDPLNLADIQSVGTLEEDGRYKMSILSHSDNLFNYQDIIDKKALDVNGNLTSNESAYTSNFISVKSSKVISHNRGISTAMCQYDKDFKFIKYTNQLESVVLDSNCKYIRIHCTYASKHPNQFMVNYGEISNPYVEYIQNKSSILLPCQLEKVGDVSDRLFRREDGIWCIEKNIGEVVLNGSESWTFVDSTKGNTSLFGTSFSIMKSSGVILSDKFNYNANGYTLDEELCYTTARINFRILKSKLSSDDVTGFKAWLSQNPTLVKYQLATPQIMELPLEQQISLNSFFGTTNIFAEDTVIEPTIKATVPKSLGASVQSLVNKTDNLSKRIDNVETLKSSQELEVSTDKGYVVCENTNNGQIEGLKIEGKTLVNLFNISKGTSAGWQYSQLAIANIKAEMPYTLMIKATEDVLVYEDDRYVITLNNEIRLIPSSSSGKTYKLLKSSEGGVSVNFECVLLEGDHTQNPPSYFEGLKSVGEGVDKIEVLSSGNKGYINFITLKDNTPNYRINPLTLLPESKANNTLTNYQRVIGGTNYKFTSDTLATVYIGVCWYDLNKNPISASTDVNGKTVQAPSNSKYCRYWFDSSLYNDNPCVCGFLFNSNKKQILFKTSEGNYEKPILRSTGSVSDTIEKHSDGKYYFHKRCEEVVLNGGSGENWRQGSYSASTLCLRFDMTSLTNVKLGIANCISDKMPTYKDANNDASEKENYYIATHQANSKFVIVIPKSKLSTQDLTGFKTWLQSNPVTVVYQLATEEVYECVNLDLDSYEGETSIIFDGGAISPKLTFKIASHISNTIQVLKDRINYLEDKVINMFKAVLAGDVQTLAYELYPEDFKEEVQEPEQIESVEGTELL